MPAKNQNILRHGGQNPEDSWRNVANATCVVFSNCNLLAVTRADEYWRLCLICPVYAGLLKPTYSRNMDKYGNRIIFAGNSSSQSLSDLKSQMIVKHIQTQKRLLLLKYRYLFRLDTFFCAVSRTGGVCQPALEMAALTVYKSRTPAPFSFPKRARKNYIFVETILG